MENDERAELMAELLSIVPGVTAMLQLIEDEEVLDALKPEFMKADYVESFEVPVRISQPLMLAMCKSVDRSVETAKRCFPLPVMNENFKNETTLAGVLGQLIMFGLKEYLTNHEEHRKQILAMVENYYEKLGLTN